MTPKSELREWWIVFGSILADDEIELYKRYVGRDKPQTYDHERPVHVIEKRPGAIQITREEMRAALVKTQREHYDQAIAGNYQPMAVRLERELFGGEGE